MTSWSKNSLWSKGFKSQSTKKDDKDQETIKSRNTLDPGYHMGK